MEEGNTIQLQPHRQESNSRTVFFLHPSLIRVVLVLIVSLCIVYSAWPSENKHLKAAVKSFAKEIEQAQFHKVYVPDFLDPSGVRTEKGCFFASTFSTNLAKDAHNFEVVNRIQAQKQLDELHISPQDLQQPEFLSKAALALGADAVLVGTATISPTDAKLFLSLREATSGKEVHSVDYHEKLDTAFESSFPATQGDEGRVYYFPGLDGVSQPKCVYCPDPEFSDEARRNQIEGSVLLSVTVEEKGAIRDVRVVQDLGHGLAQRSIDAMKKWRMEPSRDPEGKPIAVRAAIEITFRRLR
ncbi:MAG TPA: energy transducer TonB [Candidatus Angelobacter sp.]|nr:energy transducer TonB [Candidatus Angelobacter sp.]